MNPDALPLFPLHTVLFPGGLLPLQIFEVRYLDLMKRCEQTGEPFGVVCLRSGQEVRRAPRPGEGASTHTETFEGIGTLAVLEQVAHPRAGLMLVLARGGRRFKLENAHTLQHGLWVGEVSLLPDDTAVPLPDECITLGTRLQQVMRAMAEQAGDESQALPPAGDACWQEAGWVANRWAERLPLHAQERQRLMSLDNPMWRLELVSEWLERLERAGQASPGQQPPA